MSVPIISDRIDIHKSCKSIEVIVNVLNDYCEASSAVVTIQKKLTKALRESASSKCTAEIAGNAFSASATIFEALSDVDNKFTKFADKECDGISNDVKKWFKKLAKEEKAHDQRIANANAKIKQAGLSYEKKVKKNPTEAQEEHTRYINLLSTLGPEVAQDKYNHSLFVSKRHTEMLYNIAACLSRIADAEWLRSCEDVRRFSPTIGQLGQWRALCEGNWTGALPPDLTDLDAIPINQSPALSTPKRDNAYEVEGERPTKDLSPLLEKPAPEYSSRQSSEREQNRSRGPSPAGNPVSPPPTYSSPPRDLQPSLQRPSDRGTPNEDRSHSAASLTSLASFPLPPTHFPLPPVSGNDHGGEAEQTVAPDSRDQYAYSERKRDERIPATSANSSPAIESAPRAVANQHNTAASSPGGSRTSNQTEASQSPPSQRDRQTSQQETRPPTQPTQKTAITPISSSIATSESEGIDRTQQQDNAKDAEFGVRRSHDVPQQNSYPSTNTKALERSDTGKSSGSMVAALRDRYARSPGPPSPGTREVPRLPLSVSSLAGRYESPGNVPVSPRHASRPSMDDHRRVSNDPPVRSSYSPVREQMISATAYQPPSSLPSPNSNALHRQRIEERQEFEFREQEHQLRLREQEIEQRSQELERERARLQTIRSGRVEGYHSNENLNRYSVTNRPQVESPSSSPIFQSRQLQSQYSYSSTRLVPPQASTSYSNSQPSYSASSSPVTSRPSEHAPYCGCEACSASKYKARDPALSPRDVRPLEPPITLRPEKPKGWMRRLSMPVIGGAFSSDSKKAIAQNISGYRSSLALPDEEGRIRVGVTGGIRNRSTTNLGGR